MTDKKNVVDVAQVPTISAEGEQSAVLVITEQVAELNTFLKIANELNKSGMFPTLNSGKILATVLAGHERGYGAMTSLMNIHVINGRFGFSAQMIAAELRKAGVIFNVLETDTEHCKIEFQREGQRPFVYQWTVADAQRAKKLPAKPDSVWATYPQDMLFARCLTAGGRKYAPDALMGVSLKDELSEMAPDASGTIEGGMQKSATDDLADRVQHQTDASNTEEPQEEETNVDPATHQGYQNKPISLPQLINTPEPNLLQPHEKQAVSPGEIQALTTEYTRFGLIELLTNELGKTFEGDVGAGDGFLSKCVDDDVLKSTDLKKNTAEQLAAVVVKLRHRGKNGKAG